MEQYYNNSRIKRKADDAFAEPIQTSSEASYKYLRTRAAACLLLAAAIEADNEKKEQKPKRIWIKDYRKTRKHGGYYNSLMKELKPQSSDYKNFLRMDEDSFNFILTAIKPDITKQDTLLREAIPPKEKLAVTLRFLATGENYVNLDYHSKLSKSFLSSAIIEVCDAIYTNLKDQFLKFPTTKEEWLQITDGFEYKWQFPNCLGALDGKHINFKPSNKNANLYYNYKGTHSIVLLAVADAQAKFTFIDVGCNGRISDGGVLQRSDLMYILQQSDKFLPPNRHIGNSRLLPHMFVADNAFPLSEHMMTPYPYTTTDVHKKNFNRRLSRARQTIERAFGILSNRFQVFQKPINLREDKVKKIVQCCCLLHNFLITRSHWYLDNIDEVQNDDTNQIVAVANSQKTKLGEYVRTQLREYFNNEGTL